MFCRALIAAATRRGTAAVEAPPLVCRHILPPSAADATPGAARRRRAPCPRYVMPDAAAYASRHAADSEALLRQVILHAA